MRSGCPSFRFGAGEIRYGEREVRDVRPVFPEREAKECWTIGGSEKGTTKGAGLPRRGKKKKKMSRPRKRSESSLKWKSFCGRDW